MVAKKLYYTMGEVAEMFDVKASLIRHWESKFSCLRPHKNKKGNRLFTPEDVERLKQIYHLVKERGMTLDGANKVMKTSSKAADLSRDTEMLERLQRIRAALVEVREELKLGVGEQIVDADVEESAVSAVEQATNKVAEVPQGPNSEPTIKPDKESASEQTPESDVESATDLPAEQIEESTIEQQPKKRVVRRKKKSDDDNKELFPFYEQSLF